MFADSIKMVKEWLPDKYQVSDKIIQKLINFAEEEPQRKQEEAAKRTEELRCEQEATLKAVKNEETALNHVLNSFLHIESALDYKFPVSKIKLSL